MDNNIGFSSYNRHPDDDLPTRRDFLKNLAAYQYWQGKLTSWETGPILTKLRTFNVMTSKNDVLDAGEVCYSAYQLFKNWLDTFGTRPKFLENFGFIWASAERLWELFMPELLSVEAFIKLHNSVKIQNLNEAAHVLLPRYLEHWAKFVAEFVPPFQSLDELERFIRVQLG